MNRAIMFFYGFLIILLGLRFFFYHQFKLNLTNGQIISFEATILSVPQSIGNRQLLTANYKNQKIYITTSRFPELNYGQYVRISGRISIPSERVLMYYPRIELLNSGNLFKHVNSFRQKLINLFSATLPSPSSNLLLGIIFGIREEMPKAFNEDLRTVGVMHVIAASGMNVTLVAGFVSSLFALFFRRQIAVGLSILAIIFYALLAGLEPSIIRASIMGVLVFSAQILGRQTLAINGLILAAFLMLFPDPSLIADVGFQLSFAATLGILYVKPILQSKDGLFSDVTTTIAAQIVTLPILLVNFGTYSLFSIFANALVLWTVPIMMIIGGIGAAFGLVFQPLGEIILYICYPLLVYFQFVVNSFAQFGGIVSFNNIPWQFVTGYYCLLVSVILFNRKK